MGSILGAISGSAYIFICVRFCVHFNAYIIFFFTVTSEGHRLSCGVRAQKDALDRVVVGLVSDVHYIGGKYR